MENDIEFLEKFRSKIIEYLFLGYSPSEIFSYWGNDGLEQMQEALKKPHFQQLRKEIIEMKSRVYELFTKHNIGYIMTYVPAPAVGGPQIDFKMFELVTQNPTEKSITVETFTDSIDSLIGKIKNTSNNEQKTNYQVANMDVIKGFVFIAMAMAVEDDPHLDDVHDVIKNTASDCGLVAKRIDEDTSNDKITDRILSSIRSAEYVVADLTHCRPNVYYEAGYAHALQKTPIYIAKQGTILEFDIQDYPVIFFNNHRELKQKLSERLKGLIQERNE